MIPKAELLAFGLKQVVNNWLATPTVMLPPDFLALGAALLGATWLSEATSATAMTAATLRRPPRNSFFISCSPLEVDEL